jgi:predicted pyridoxine 5'-phosphate oxidase superfamily flavin-nucleotide-binding protein
VALMPSDYNAVPEAAVVFEIDAWDTNCPQHIPQKFDAADVARALADRDARIAALETELAALKAHTGDAA